MSEREAGERRRGHEEGGGEEGGERRRKAMRAAECRGEKNECSEGGGWEGEEESYEEGWGGQPACLYCISYDSRAQPPQFTGAFQAMVRAMLVRERSLTSHGLPGGGNEWTVNAAWNHSTCNRQDSRYDLKSIGEGSS